MSSEDEKYEKIGRAVFSFSYLMYALSFIAVATLVSGIIMFLSGISLWFAPLAGTALFMVYRWVRILIVRVIFRLIK